MLCFTLFLIFISPFCNGADILAILPTPAYSHQIAYTHIWKELSLRGHKVTLITTDPIKDSNLINLTEIDMNWTYKFMADIGKVAQQFTMWNMHRISHNMMKLVNEAMLSYSEVQNLIHNKSHFDVVLAEFVCPEFLAFAEIYNCPKILFSTLDASSAIHNFLGNPLHPILYPDIGAGFIVPSNFNERVISTLYTWYTLYFYNYEAFYEKNELVKKYFNVSKTIHELLTDVDLLFLNVNPILQPIRALGPSTIMIGGNRGVILPEPLPKDIADFLNSANDGFVYFSLGSNVKSKDLIAETLEAITEALRELPYKVLWKFEADEFPNKPDNVKLIKWAPQQTILSHPNIKVFVTQGGLQSFEEALYRGVPFVVIPFMADQVQNANIMKSKGIAVIVNRLPSVNKIDLKNAILEVIQNPTYKNEIMRLKHLASDFPMTGQESAIWWTEYVIRNKGAKHLRNPAADIPFYQYYLVDVIGFLVLIINVMFLLLFLAFRTIYRFVRSKSLENVNDANKKKSE